MRLRSPLRVTLFLLVLALVGCKKDHPQCDKLADYAMSCDQDFKSSPAHERKAVRAMMDGMCEEAFRNDTSSVSGEAKEMVVEVYAGLRKRANCAATVTSCNEYEKVCDTH